jgi:hypothetical protein
VHYFLAILAHVMDGAPRPDPFYNQIQLDGGSGSSDRRCPNRDV